MGCGASTSAGQPTAHAAAPAGAPPVTTTGKAPAVNASGPSPEYLEGQQVVKPTRPSFPPKQASKGKWNDLMDACESGGDVKSLMQKYPVDAGDENCWTALMEAAEKGWTNAVEDLLNG